MDRRDAPRVAVVGLGPFGLEHLRQYTDLGVEVVAVTDTDSGRRAAVAQQFDVAVVDSFAALLDRKPAAVSLVTGPEGNRVLVPQLLAAGVPVLVEKPFAETPADAEFLAGLRGAAQLVRPGHVLRYDQGCRQVADLVGSGAVGRVLAIDAERHRDTDHARYRPQHSPASLTMYHDIDLAHWIAGAHPIELHARQAGSGSVLAVMIRDARDALWTLRSSWTLPTGQVRERLRITGTEGTVVLEGSAVHLLDRSGDHVWPVIGNPLRTELAEFCADVMVGRGPQSVTVADAVTCVRTVAAIEELCHEHAHTEEGQTHDRS